MGLKQVRPCLNHGFCSQPTPGTSTGSRKQEPLPWPTASCVSTKPHSAEGHSSPGLGPVSGKQLSAFQCPLPLSPATHGSSRGPSSPREHRICLEKHQRNPALQSSIPYCPRHPLPLEGRPRPAAASLYPHRHNPDTHRPHSSLPPVMPSAHQGLLQPQTQTTPQHLQLQISNSGLGKLLGGQMLRTPFARPLPTPPGPLHLRPCSTESGQGLSPWIKRHQTQLAFSRSAGPTTGDARLPSPRDST